MHLRPLADCYASAHASKVASPALIRLSLVSADSSQILRHSSVVGVAAESFSASESECSCGRLRSVTLQNPRSKLCLPALIRLSLVPVASPKRPADSPKHPDAIAAVRSFFAPESEYACGNLQFVTLRTPRPKLRPLRFPSFPHACRLTEHPAASESEISFGNLQFVTLRHPRPELRPLPVPPENYSPHRNAESSAAAYSPLRSEPAAELAPPALIPLSCVPAATSNSLPPHPHAAGKSFSAPETECSCPALRSVPLRNMRPELRLCALPSFPCACRFLEQSPTASARCRILLRVGK